MAKQSKKSGSVSRRPAISAEDRENQLIAAAVNLAEQQILEGTASAQVIVHFLKLGTTKEKLEKEKLITENELLKAKIENLETAKRTEEMYIHAIDAMRKYSGGDDEK